MESCRLTYLDGGVEELVLLLVVHRLALVHPARLDDSPRILPPLCSPLTFASSEQGIEARDGVVQVARPSAEVRPEADKGRLKR